MEMEGRLLFETALRNGKEITVGLLDIDHFKRVNDRYGHDTGDQVLRKIAGVCRRVIRSMDSLCRFGGEEFVFILPETSFAEARRVLDRLREILGNLEHKGIEGRITVSFGFCSGIPLSGQGVGFFLSGRIRPSIIQRKREETG